MRIRNINTSDRFLILYSKVNGILLLYALLFFCFFLVVPSFAFAKPVGVDVVEKVARVWLSDNGVFVKAKEELGGDSFRISSVSPIYQGRRGRVLAYHVDLSPMGYLVVSGDDLLHPVICYSPDGELDLSDKKNNSFRTMFRKDMARSDDFVIFNEGKNQLNKNQNKWGKLLDRFAELEIKLSDTSLAEEVIDFVTDQVVGPFLATVWNQNHHYNNFCPDDPLASAYYDGKMPAGCIAVAAAQFMKFHQWPPRGTGQHSYQWNTEILSASFDDSFVWTNMVDFYDPWGVEPVDLVHAVAELIYELGVSVDMDYDHDGSASSPVKLNSSLGEYFFYKPGVFTRRLTDPHSFDEKIRAEMIAGHPVITSIPGHAIVADGLDSSSGDDYYHINYGWGGINNNWYLLTGIAGTSTVTDALFDLQPIFYPLLREMVDEIDSDANFILQWDFPWTRVDEVGYFKLWEGIFHNQDFWDEGDDFTAWRQSGGWQLVSPGYGETGSAFYVPPDLLGNFSLTLASPIRVVGSVSSLSFYYKAYLGDAHFIVETSIDNGLTWDEHVNITDERPKVQSPWTPVQIDLSAYGGENLLLRFRSNFEFGAYFLPPLGGLWLDNIGITGVEQLSWHLVADSLLPQASEFELTGRVNGSYYFAVQPCNAAGCFERSPVQEVNVFLSIAGDFNTDLDVDGADLVIWLYDAENIDLKTLSGAFGQFY